MTGRRRMLVAAGAGALLVLVVIMVFGRPRPAPLAPDSTEPDGARALVALLEAHAVEVEVADRVPDRSVDVAILLVDDAGARAAAQLAEWVRAGGRLIVADPASPFVSPSVATAGVLPSGCNIDALAAVADIVAAEPRLFEFDGADAVCFADPDRAFVHVTEVGAVGGALIAVGDPLVFSNALLAEGDNAVLAVALAAPAPETRLVVLEPAFALNPALDTPDVDTEPTPGEAERPEIGTGSSGVFGLLPGYLRWIALNLTLAWLVYALARGRRLGRPVPESVPVELAGSELVRARGRLLRRTSVDATIAPLQRSVRHDLADALGLPRSVDLDVLVRAVGDRTGMDPAAVRDAFTVPTRADDRVVVELTRQLDHIRQEVLREQRIPADI